MFIVCIIYVYIVAPEVIQGQPPTTACDIWSLGITIIGLFNLYIVLFVIIVIMLYI